MNAPFFYVVYSAATDFPICCGSAKECATALGVKDFYALVSNVSKGINRKYHIVKLCDEEEEVTDYV